MKNPESRREFFQSLSKSRPQTPPDLEMLRVGRPAMGSRFEILLSSKYRRKIEAVHRALDEVRRLERMMTIFSDDSQITRLNRNGLDSPVQLDPDLMSLLQESARISNATGGAFDVTAGALWRCWGFSQKMGVLPSEKEIEEALECVGFVNLELDSGNSTARLLKGGVEINLGSIGKGFALDRAGLMVQNAGLGEVMLHAGHSSFLAFGDPGMRGGWKVSVRHPLDQASSFMVLRLRNIGMATSGVAEQFFEIDGKRYGHIIDPRSGRPAEMNISSTALASSAATADALSTAFFVMSLDEIEDFCRENPSVGAVIIPSPEEGEALRMHCFGVAAEYLVDG